ncbi:DUF3710 domain-containing protein [Dietzia sp.]|uniref:DUF3710 domain-containing protein n=1 Tax=Dietzia sp. TaxID=1871616 RepID=UPI002FD8F78A
MFGRRKGEKAAKADESAAGNGAEAAAAADDATSGSNVSSGRAANGAAADGFPFDPEEGPFDKSAVPDVDEFYGALGYGYFDLGSLVLGIPPNAQLNAALNQDGSPEFHVVTESVRVIPRAYSAPRSGGLWREQLGSIRQQLDAQGAHTSHEDGPWGRELVAEQSGATLRMVGVEGPRWLLEARIVSTTEQAEEAAEAGRDIIARFVVNRGSGPMPSGEMLPMEIPADIAENIEKARQQMAQQQAAATRAAQAGMPQPAQTQTHAQQQAQQQAQAEARRRATEAAQAGGGQASAAQANAAQASAAQANATQAAGADRQAQPGAAEAPNTPTRKRVSAMDRLHELDEEK